MIQTQDSVNKVSTLLSNYKSQVGRLGISSLHHIAISKENSLETSSKKSGNSKSPFFKISNSYSSVKQVAYNSGTGTPKTPVSIFVSSSKINIIYENQSLTSPGLVRSKRNCSKFYCNDQQAFRACKVQVTNRQEPKNIELSPFNQFYGKSGFQTKEFNFKINLINNDTDSDSNSDSESDSDAEMEQEVASEGRSGVKSENTRTKLKKTSILKNVADKIVEYKQYLNDLQELDSKLEARNQFRITSSNVRKAPNRRIVLSKSTCRNLTKNSETNSYTNQFVFLSSK